MIPYHRKKISISQKVAVRLSRKRSSNSDESFEKVAKQQEFQVASEIEIIEI